MKYIDGGVTAAKGFKASGIHCGIRKNQTKKSNCLYYSICNICGNVIGGILFSN